VKFEKPGNLDIVLFEKFNRKTLNHLKINLKHGFEF